MSIHLHKTIVLKLDKKEYDLIMFIRSRMPYGKCVLITKDGKPVRVEKATESILLGVERKVSVEN